MKVKKSVSTDLDKDLVYVVNNLWIVASVFIKNWLKKS